nr:CDP-glucose 4,6-dehydratase [Enorma phocaeensis]
MEVVVALRYGVASGFWQGKRVFLTGHTGFKGSWMTAALVMAGADVYGYALEPEGPSALYNRARLDRFVHSYIADIRDASRLSAAIKDARPDIVVHMAAQPLVIDSFTRPAYTYETNVMGTVNILEALRSTDAAASFLNVTTDKVYFNEELPGKRYREGDRLDGFDPYSNSKSCSELVTATYERSFFAQDGPAISTARSGNVIGAGDWADNRIVPDCVRAVLAGESIEIRNPNSTRPYQHVLEPISAYMEICGSQFDDRGLASSYNVGPDDESCVTTGELADLFCSKWGDGATWKAVDVEGPHEANFLALDHGKITSDLGWMPHWGIEEAVAQTASGYRELAEGLDAWKMLQKGIEEYFGM